MSKEVNKRELCEIFGVTERSVTTWQKQGLPVSARGSRGVEGVYDTERVFKWFIERAEAKSKKQDSKYFDLEHEKGRLAHAQANKVEIEVKQMESSLIPAEIILNTWQQLVSAMRAKVLAIPTKSARSVAQAESLNEIEDCIKIYCNEALEEISTDGIPAAYKEFIAESLDGDDEDGNASTGFDGEPVGRSEEDVELRGKRRARSMEH